MKKAQECKTIMESAVVELYMAENFCEQRLLAAQKLYLEGEKRRLRYLSVIYHEVIRYFQTDFFDLYGQNLDCTHKEVTYAATPSVSEYFKKTIVFFEDLYDKLHESANALMPALCYRYACKLLDLCNKISCIIVEYRRITGEGDACGWNSEFTQRLMAKEQTAENIHDHYESKEESLGYKQ